MDSVIKEQVDAFFKENEYSSIGIYLLGHYCNDESDFVIDKTYETRLDALKDLYNSTDTDKVVIDTQDNEVISVLPTSKVLSKSEKLITLLFKGNKSKKQKTFAVPIKNKH